MFWALRKSRLLSALAMDRMTDYMDLLRVEVKIREHDIGVKVVGFAVAGLFALLATIFLGLAVIVTFWDSPYRAAAAWSVVLLYGVIAAICVGICMKHFQSQSIATSLRGELQRDIDIIKENI
ncbi:phage holin family protein [Noviherbaspirillum cavernae]|nr:phage holin family protein [Noviherbaspirillum cavernae]